MTEPSDLTPTQTAAAFHGLATNPALPPGERLKLALQALDLYAAVIESPDPDYREILIKYIQHVVDCEGVTFVPIAPDDTHREPGFFTPDEHAALCAAEAEAARRDEGVR